MVRLADLGHGPLMHVSDGSYFGWLDLRDHGFADIEERALRLAGTALFAGERYGEGGSGFARVNFATVDPVLDQFVEQFARVLESTPA